MIHKVPTKNRKYLQDCCLEDCDKLATEYEVVYMVNVFKLYHYATYEAAVQKVESLGCGTEINVHPHLLTQDEYEDAVTAWCDYAFEHAYNICMSSDELEETKEQWIKEYIGGDYEVLDQ